MFKTLVRWGFMSIVPIVLVVQLLPYGRDHTNPPGGVEPQWDTPQTRELAVRACFDCHSNETTWPWYSSVAPVSWLVQLDVDRGRRHLNLSEWDKAQRGGREAAETVQRGQMPPSYYVLMHPAAGLSTAEKQSLLQGLQATLSGGPGGSGTGNQRPGGG